jgi:hypothetical protein
MFNPLGRGGDFAHTIKNDKAAMLKLIEFLVVAIPVVLFLKAIFLRKGSKFSQALADFQKQIDYLVWAILFMIGCGLIYSLGKLLLS